ncbi:MAG: stage II sporulation protein M [Chloroflexota bacterium]
MLLFGALYRQAAADLALAQREYPHAEITRYLNSLVARAHPYVYRSELLDLGRLVAFYRTALPQAAREASPYILASFLISLLAAGVSFAVTVTHPDAAAILLPAGSERIVDLIKHHQLWMDVPGGTNSAVASFIMTNNIRVALMAFAGGVLLGLVTVYILVVNGLMLGTVAGLCQAYGLSLGLWSFIAPHGVIELSMIFVAGGAGLMLGWAVLRPGLRRRQDALAVAARRAVLLLFGVVPLLVVAGTLEGFVSPSPLPAVLKFGVGLLTGLVLAGYATTGRRPHGAAGQGR